MAGLGDEKAHPKRATAATSPISSNNMAIGKLL
jgi:hypothetical protein